MNESNTRKWLRARVKAIALGQTKHGYRVDNAFVDGWVDDLMQTPELSLAEYAEQHGGTLAVIDTSRQYHPVPPDPDGATYYAVVRMEGE